MENYLYAHLKLTRTQDQNCVHPANANQKTNNTSWSVITYNDDDSSRNSTMISRHKLQNIRCIQPFLQRYGLDYYQYEQELNTRISQMSYQVK